MYFGLMLWSRKLRGRVGELPRKTSAAVRLAQTPRASVVCAGSASQHGASLEASGILDEAFSTCS